MSEKINGAGKSSVHSRISKNIGDIQRESGYIGNSGPHSSTHSGVRLLAV